MLAGRLLGNGSGYRLMREEYDALSGFECRVDIRSITLDKVDTEESLKLIDAISSWYS